MTAAEVLRALRRDGWQSVRQSGSHVILRHETRPGMVVVPRHPGVTLKSSIIASILKDAGLSSEHFQKLL
ncbi:MAG: addiction module toxin, HicA family [Dehalococcoidia bacterium]|nr:addiction module toxin, HicA family [Dehalococcoidia bacterium]